MLDERYQRTVSSTCAGCFGVPTQAIFHVYFPVGSGSYEALQ